MKKRVLPRGGQICGWGESSSCCSGCFGCSSMENIDRMSDVSKAPSVADFIFSKNSKSSLDKIADAVCLIQHSPFRILRIAEQGNVKEFTRLITADPSKLNIRDGRGRASIHQATIKNHVKILEVVAGFNGNLDLTDNHGNSALHLAVEVEATETLEFLLANGANTRLLNERFQSPLHLAAELNKISALKVMAKFHESIDPNLPGEHGRRALHLAAINDNEECMKILLYQMGALPNLPCKHGFFPIHEAAKHASSRSMEILLTWGELEGHCSREEMISFFDAEGNVPLHSAVHGGDIKAVELCLRSGAKISTQQHDLSTPVHLACSQGSMEIIKLMFELQPEEKEICLKSCDVQRKTALHLASMFDHHSLVEFLIEQGASVNSLDKEKRTPLHLAASRNGWKTVKTLIKLGANISLKDSESRNVLHTIVINGGDLEKILDDEFCADFVSILEDKDKFGATPLYYSSKLGHIKTTARLIQLGASIITKNNVGENPFHVACRYGRLQIVLRILKMEQSNSVINEGDGKGRTPLHISSAEGHVRVVQALIKKGALLHRDHQGSSVLHYASAKGQREVMKLILNVHSQLLDQTDKDGNTPLHVGAMENQPLSCFDLLERNCNLTYNFNGFSACDFAITNKFTSVALVMVTHKKRGDEVLSMTDGKHPSIMLALIATMPQVVSALLDRCITKSDAKSDSEHFHSEDVIRFVDMTQLQIKYDFKWLALAKTTTENSKYLPILNGMVTWNRVELLSHDLSQKYLAMKWSGYGRFVHVTQLLFYSLYLALITSHASNFSMANHHAPFTNTTISFWEGSGMGYGIGVQESVQAAFVIAISLLCLLREGQQMMSKGYFLNSSNWVFWGMNVACVLMILSKFFDIVSLVNPSASIATFLSWFYLLLFLQRFDVVGIYVVMFLEILHTLLRVLMIFSILIIAFGLAFYILLSNAKHRAFNQIPISLMRTFSMMLGDLDFMNTFVNPHFCQVEFGEESELAGSEEEASGCSKNDRKLPNPISSFFMLGVFMVLMPILLMNLLIGLAVGDIDSVRRNAQLKRLAMQVHLHTALEKTLPEFILREVEKAEVIEYPNQAKARLGLLQQFFNFFQPKSNLKGSENGEEELTDDLVDAVAASSRGIADLSNRLENMETLLRLLCHKLELSTEADFMDEGTQVDDASPMSDIKSKFKRGVTIRLTKVGKCRPPPPSRSDSNAN